MNRREHSICPVCLKKGNEPDRIPSAVPWKNNSEMEDRTHCDDAWFYECSACGSFAISDIDAGDARTSDRVWAGRDRAQVSALLREQAIRPLPPYWVQFGMEPYGPLKWRDLAPIDVDELLAKWPRTVPKRLDRMLCNFARLSPTGGHRVNFDPEDTSLAFAETGVEAGYNFRCLLAAEWVDDDGSKDLAEIHGTLTPKGWQRFEELTQGKGAPENDVFVAMWYGAKENTEECGKTEKEMSRVFEDGIKLAVEDAGYQAIRVDLVQHNEWIMDQVLGLIRLAPFVVADFTGHRNGVYFEAGFARGLGKPVIQTCETGELEKAHFDTRQLNHVLWKTPKELRERLCQRIIGSPIGRGPHPPASPGS